jgi:hypothetical protein
MIETDELDRPAIFERKVCADLRDSFSIGLAEITNAVKMQNPDVLNSFILPVSLSSMVKV